MIGKQPGFTKTDRFEVLVGGDLPVQGDGDAPRVAYDVQAVPFRSVPLNSVQDEFCQAFAIRKLSKWPDIK